MPAPKMSARHALVAVAIAIMGLVIALDQLSKWMVLMDFTDAGHGAVTVSSFFNIVLVLNYGISFGMFSARNQPLLLILMAFAIIGILLFWLFRNHAKLVAYGLGCVIGGAVGNVIDRLRYGAVVDFLDFHLGGYHWPAFNIADSCIFIGVVLLCGSSMLAPSPHNSPEGS